MIARFMFFYKPGVTDNPWLLAQDQNYTYGENPK